MNGRTHLLGRSAFLVLGWTGFGLAVVLVLALCAATGLSVAVQAAISLAAVAVYVAVAALARRRLGRPALIYYHHVLAFLACAAAVAAVAGAPVLEHLDVTACGLAVFTAVARVGCLTVGCCHGRPARHGVTYGPAHVRLGLPGYLVGVALLPVQAIEAAGCGAIAVAGCAAVLAGAPAGTALVAFTAGYALLRFPLEWMRGDLLRPHRARLSEAQWTSLAVAAAVAGAGLLGAVPGGVLAMAPLAVLTGAATLTRRGHAPGARAPLAALNVADLAARLDAVATSGAVTRTSAGLLVSAGETGGRAHYTLSRQGGGLSRDEVHSLGRLLAWMRGPQAHAEIVPGQAGAFHLVMDQEDG